jgi:formylglycine-generating enzyme required for sulfatase activity
MGLAVGLVALVAVALLAGFLLLSPRQTAQTAAGPTPERTAGAPAGGSPAASPTPLVIKPTHTPVPAPPTRTPRPSATPAPLPAVASPAPTRQGQPTASPAATEFPRPAVETVEVPAGPFTMGDDNSDPKEAPAHSVELPAFFMDKFEVTNADFAMFVAASGYQTEAEQRNDKKTWRTFYTQDKDNHPVVKVTFNDAQAFCQWLGKRLPSEEEWEKAARGTDGRDFPWGNLWDNTRANVRLSGLRSTVTVGSFAAGASPYGVEDMSGNVWEWTTSPYLAYPGSTYQDPQYTADAYITRGGGWFDDDKQVRTTARSAAVPWTANDDLGFRCVADSK